MERVNTLYLGTLKGMKLVDEANLISRYVEVLKNKSKLLATMSV